MARRRRSIVRFLLTAIPLARTGAPVRCRWSGLSSVSRRLLVLCFRGPSSIPVGVNTRRLLRCGLWCLVVLLVVVAGTGFVVGIAPYFVAAAGAWVMRRMLGGSMVWSRRRPIPPICSVSDEVVIVVIISMPNGRRFATHT
ncbi:hypothetical protein BKH16_09610 [Actinomyces oris]|nr:hypothetical protein BKH16_09610 [Actinomyces oris]